MRPSFGCGQRWQLSPPQFSYPGDHTKVVTFLVASVMLHQSRDSCLRLGWQVCLQTYVHGLTQQFWVTSHRCSLRAVGMFCFCLQVLACWQQLFSKGS